MDRKSEKYFMAVMILIVLEVVGAIIIGCTFDIITAVIALASCIIVDLLAFILVDILAVLEQIAINTRKKNKRTKRLEIEPFC